MGDYDALGAVIVVFLIIAFVILAIILAIYIIVGIFLNKFNKLLYGYGTALAFIPIGNVYLMGKLAFNKAVGYILIGLQFGIPLTNSIIKYSTRGEVAASFLSLLSSLTGIFNLVCLIVAIVKYNNIKKGFLSAEAVAMQSDSTNIQEAFSSLNSNQNSNPYNNQVNSQQFNNPNMQNQNMNNPNVQMNDNSGANPNACPSCGSTITEATKFCTHCGTKIRD